MTLFVFFLATFRLLFLRFCLSFLLLYEKSSTVYRGVNVDPTPTFYFFAIIFIVKVLFIVVSNISFYFIRTMPSSSSSEEFPSDYEPSSDEGEIDSLSGDALSDSESLSGDEVSEVAHQYVSKNGKEIWNSRPFVNRGRLSAENVLKQKEGVTTYAIHRVNTIESALDLFLTSEIVQVMLVHLYDGNYMMVVIYLF